MVSTLSIVAFLFKLIDFYQILIVVWCILSWIPMREGGIMYDVASAINTLVSPYVNLFRRFLPPLGGIDLSPMLAIVVLMLIERGIMSILV
ncbi:MAG: YggT family protein [Coriobacteriales bacterium]|nr:YggT family protein [Coriobacteriales bacterium]